MVYFTRKSENKSFKESFYSLPNTISKDVHFWCDNLLLRLFSVHYFSFYLNRHKEAVVLSSNSTFFYDMLPFLKKDIVTIELLHMFTHGKKGMEYFGLANYKSLTYRFIIDTNTLDNIVEQYKKYHVPKEYLNRILLIEPGVDTPPYQSKSTVPLLKVMYAGRGGPQKRIHLINKIAEHCITNYWPVQFHFAGTMLNELSALVRDNAILYGEISSKAEMNKLYQNCHVVLMTSAYEGFPMLIKEAMACGCIPVVTALKGNVMHLKHQQNALLINEIEDEEKVIDQSLENLKALIDNPSLLNFLSDNVYHYALDNFRKNTFMERCREILVR